MNYRKMLGLVLAIAAVTMAFAGSGTASATTLCADTACTETYAAGTTLHLKAEKELFQYPHLGTECGLETYQAKTTNSGGATETVQANFESNSTECGGGSEICTWVFLKKGTWEIHTDKEDGRTTGENGTLTSNGAEITVNCFGHCVYRTSNTPMGTITGGSPATLHTSAMVPRVGGKSGVACGTQIHWTGSYQVTSPSSLWVK